ncbi:hypothetical protein [Actinomadura sp. NPDC049753]|uniref:hypothetical protein n=1 Tax=Actinomadura sp. NPDC049753 TaxID=3154739 RepID=UPI00342DDC08
MADDKTTSSPNEAKRQQGDGDWPRPGDEGYVNPDGTPQAARQLEDNRRAAADRAAAGSTVHGAPLATPGPQAGAENLAAAKRAEAYSGTTQAEAEEGLTKFVRDKTEEAAREGGSSVPADRAGQENAADRTPKTKR